MEILVFPFKSDTSLIFNKNSWYNGNFSLFKKYIYDLPVCFWCIFDQGKIFTTFENHKNTIYKLQFQYQVHLCKSFEYDTLIFKN